MYYVYVLRSAKSGRLYTGYTADVGHRLGQHNVGITRSTRQGAPWKLIHPEPFETRRAAMQRERFLKSGRGEKS
jgi:putative endonuclease